MKKSIPALLLTALLALSLTGCAPKNTVLATDEVQTAGQTYRVELVQTKYVAPPPESECDLWMKPPYGYYGSFALRVRTADGQQTDLFQLNPLFDDRTMMFPCDYASSPRTTAECWVDYNGDGQPDMAVGQWSPNYRQMQYRILTLNGDGKIAQLPIDGGYIVSEDVMSDDPYNRCLLTEHDGKQVLTNSLDFSSTGHMRSVSEVYAWTGTQFAKTGEKFE